MQAHRGTANDQTVDAVLSHPVLPYGRCCNCVDFRLTAARQNSVGSAEGEKCRNENETEPNVDCELRGPRAQGLSGNIGDRVAGAMRPRAGLHVLVHLSMHLLPDWTHCARSGHGLSGNEAE